MFSAFGMPSLVFLSRDIEGCYRYVGLRPAYITVYFLYSAYACMFAMQKVVTLLYPCYCCKLDPTPKWRRRERKESKTCISRSIIALDQVWPLLPAQMSRSLVMQIHKDPHDLQRCLSISSAITKHGFLVQWARKSRLYCWCKSVAWSQIPGSLL